MKHCVLFKALLQAKALKIFLPRLAKYFSMEEIAFLVTPVFVSSEEAKKSAGELRFCLPLPSITLASGSQWGCCFWSCQKILASDN